MCSSWRNKPQSNLKASDNPAPLNHNERCPIDFNYPPDLKMKSEKVKIQIKYYIYQLLTF